MRRRDAIALVGATSIAWPLDVGAQPAGQALRLAILAQVGPPANADPADRAARQRLWTAFFDELRRRGHDEGRNLIVEWWSSADDAQHGLAREVGTPRPDVIFSPDMVGATGWFRDTTLQAARTIPIVTLFPEEGLCPASPDPAGI